MAISSKRDPEQSYLVVVQEWNYSADPAEALALLDEYAAYLDNQQQLLNLRALHSISDGESVQYLGSDRWPHDCGRPILSRHSPQRHCRHLPDISFQIEVEV